MRKITQNEARAISGGRWKCRRCGKIFGGWIFAHVTHFTNSMNICDANKECWVW